MLLLSTAGTSKGVNTEKWGTTVLMAAALYYFKHAKD